MSACIVYGGYIKSKKTLISDPLHKTLEYSTITG